MTSNPTSKQIAVRHAQFLRRYLLRQGCEIARTPDEIGIFEAASFLESLPDETRAPQSAHVSNEGAIHAGYVNECRVCHPSETRAPPHDLVTVCKWIRDTAEADPQRADSVSVRRELIGKMTALLKLPETTSFRKFEGDAKATTCWRCYWPYDIERAKCPHCLAANANVDMPLAQVERSAQETAGERESAWLIEMPGLDLYFSPGYRSGRWEWMSPDHNEAIRFARKQDAERLRAHLNKFNTTFFSNPNAFVATEHIWAQLGSALSAPLARRVETGPSNEGLADTQAARSSEKATEQPLSAAAHARAYADLMGRVSSAYPSYCKFCGFVTPCGCPAGSVANGEGES